jgi:hypothetical protein
MSTKNISEEAVNAYGKAWEAARERVGDTVAPTGTKTREGLGAALPFIVGGLMYTTDQVKHAVADWNHPLATSSLAHSIGVWLDDNNLAVVSRDIAGESND